MKADLLLAIDQGTTGTTSLVMDTSGATLGRATREFRQHFPEPGLVEHDAEEIWQSVLDAVKSALAAAGVDGDRIAAIGITNQRETTLVWERATGRPIRRAIVWQDRRTAGRCAELRAAGHEEAVQATTGLVLDPYFSGTKLAWILDHVEGARARAERGELAFGTIDSFLVFRLSGDTAGGAPVHITDITNASRTLLMSLKTLDWDDAMLSLFQVPRAVLPKITGSAERVAVTRGFPSLPDGIPIAGIAGDQQAALFGQACFGVGDAKCTYGTGAFVLSNIGRAPIRSRFGLLTTVAWKIGAEVTFALEGSAFIAGAAVQWLRDGLGLIKSASDIEGLARCVPSSGGVSFVPALSGLGAPYWDANARGLITGITRGTTAAHLARATLEGIALEVNDLLAAMAEDLGKPLAKMRVDGGAAANDLLMQFQADVSAMAIERTAELESTARGAAMLAGVGAGLFRDVTEAAGMSKVDRLFQIEMTRESREAHRRQWADAVARTRTTLERSSSRTS
jgi:glycerol kinase